MAIYSCNMKSIGRSTHAAGTAGAHIRYISRPDADPVLLSEHMPYEHNEARSFIDMRERAMRKNARVIDKLRIALPRELNEEQRAALVEAYMGDLTGTRVPWFAAIHQRGKDAHNPHVHIAVHDRDIETGKRVLRLSDSARDRRKAGLPGPQAVEWIRERWEVVCNEALEQSGHAVRIDRRTLVAQGIDRKAGIHEGPRARHIQGNVRRPESRQRINGCGRLIDYPSIDQGRTRREFNAHIIALNLERAARTKNPLTAVWAQFERQEFVKDQTLEDRLAGERQQRTSALRGASQAHLARIKKLREDRDQERRAAIRRVQGRFNPQREAMRTHQSGERAALKDKQSKLHVRILRILDITGITSRRQDMARKVLAVRHRRDRKALSERYHESRGFAEGTVKTRYAERIEDAQKGRLADLAQVKERHAHLARFAENERQQREIEREHRRKLTEGKITAWKKDRKDEGPLGVESSFAKAMKRAAEDEARRSSGRGKDDDFERER